MDKVTLKLSPICVCKYVFTDLKIIKEFNKVGDVVFHYYRFVPYKCPNCGKIIESVEYDNIVEKGDVICY